MAEPELITRERWREYFLPRAEEGDPKAQIAVGIGYAVGKMVPNNLEESERWLRLAAERCPDIAFFHLLRILSSEENARISDVFYEKDSWNLGANDLVYARYLIRHGKRDEGIALMKTGKEKGSIA